MPLSEQRDDIPDIDYSSVSNRFEVFVEAAKTRGDMDSDVLLTCNGTVMRCTLEEFRKFTYENRIC